MDLSLLVWLCCFQNWYLIMCFCQPSSWQTSFLMGHVKKSPNWAFHFKIILVWALVWIWATTGPEKLSILYFAVCMAHFFFYIFLLKKMWAVRLKSYGDKIWQILDAIFCRQAIDGPKNKTNSHNRGFLKYMGFFCNGIFQFTATLNLHIVKHYE